MHGSEHTGCSLITLVDSGTLSNDSAGLQADCRKIYCRSNFLCLTSWREKNQKFDELTELDVK